MVKKYYKEFENLQRYKLAQDGNYYPKRNKLSKAVKRQRKLERKAKLKIQNPKSVRGPNPTRNYYLYALRLEDGFYYVGVTAYKDATRRFEQHVAGKGAKWTRLHKPLEIIEVRNIGICRQTTAIEAECLMTREYMKEYGLYKVRGGDLCYVKDTMVALHFNKTPIYSSSGKRIKKSVRSAKMMDKAQEQLAAELSWIT